VLAAPSLQKKRGKLCGMNKAGVQQLAEAPVEKDSTSLDVWLRGLPRVEAEERLAALEAEVAVIRNALALAERVEVHQLPNDERAMYTDAIARVDNEKPFSEEELDRLAAIPGILLQRGHRLQGGTLLQRVSYRSPASTVVIDTREQHQDRRHKNEACGQQ
jgi:hypothetical protein